MMSVVNNKYLERKDQYFKDVKQSDWESWEWQTKHRISTAEELEKYIKLTDEEKKGIISVLTKLRMAITPYYLTLIDPLNVNCPIRLQAIPLENELFVGKNDLYDPLAEDQYSPVPGLTHRYPDRVLFFNY